MADNQVPQVPKARGSELAGLERFANQVFGNSQGTYTLDDFQYLDDTPLFSAAAFQVVNGTIAGDFTLFSTPEGSPGQGWPVATFSQLSMAETNLQQGQANGKFPQNQAYVGIAGGFDVYMIPADRNGALTQLGGINIPDPSDLHQILSGITWSWNIGGRQSPTIEYEPIKAWPTGFGVYTSGAAGTSQASANGGPLSSMRKFPFPLMFPPNIAASLKIRVNRAPSALVSIPNNSLIVVAAHLRGYMLTMVK